MMGHGAVYLSADGYTSCLQPGSGIFSQFILPRFTWKKQTRLAMGLQDASPFDRLNSIRLDRFNYRERVSNQLMGIRTQNNEAITVLRAPGVFEDLVAHQSPPHLCLIFEDASDQKDLEHKLKKSA